MECIHDACNLSDMSYMLCKNNRRLFSLLFVLSAPKFVNMHKIIFCMQGLMSDSEKDSILAGLVEIERRIEAGEFVWRTDREDVHMNIEAALTDLIGEPAKKLHTARSRNDQVVTDLRLWCRDAIDKIVTHIRQLQVSFTFCIAP